MLYSEKLIKHFTNPKNVGAMKNPSGVGVVGNPVCGDIMKVYIKVEGDVIKDVKFETLGCAAAIATSSMITDLAKGKKVSQALQISKTDIADALDGLPPIKMHCSNLAADALKKAIEDYHQKAICSN